MTETKLKTFVREAAEELPELVSLAVEDLDLVNP